MTTTERKVLVIERSKWRRGGPDGGDGVTRLLNDRGLMCCLGFDALACGVPKAVILNMIDPESLVGNRLVPEGYFKGRVVEAEEGDREEVNSQAINDAISVNDDPGLSDGDREDRLAPILTELGWDDVVFID